MKDLLILSVYFFRFISVGLGVGAALSLPLSIQLNEDIAFMLLMIMISTILTGLSNILKTTGKEPICIQNAVRFKRMGYMVWLFLLLDAMMNFSYESPMNIMWIAGKGGLKTPTIVYAITAGVMFVIARMFEEAITLKEENDLTV